MAANNFGQVEDKQGGNAFALDNDLMASITGAAANLNAGQHGGSLAVGGEAGLYEN